MTGATPYLSLCSLYRDHAGYLREWIEFHRLVGVERFFLYDNESSDDHEEVLAPYVERGIVAVHHWPSPESVRRGVPWGISAAFNDCLARHRDDSRWIGFIDVDEFLFSPTGRTLPDVLAGFERFPGVEVSRLEFGPSGHRTRPAGPVIECYTSRRSYISPERDRENVKSVIDPTRARAAMNAHGFRYAEGHAVNEKGEPTPEESPRERVFPQASLLRINHYVTKSAEEFEQKHAQWAAAGGLRGGRDRQALFESLSAEHDELVVRLYGSALREALVRASG